MVKETNYNF